MKLSDKAYIIILMVAVLSIGLVSRQRFKELSWPLDNIELPEIETSGTNLEDFLPSEEKSYKEWLSPDGTLQLQYPSNWMKIDETLLEAFEQTDAPLPEYKVFFFASLIDVRGKTVAALTVSVIDQEKDLDEIIGIIERGNEKQGEKTTVIGTETEGDVVWIEILSEYPNQPNFFSKGRLISAEDKTYLIIFSAPQTDWPRFEEEANEILNSAHSL